MTISLFVPMFFINYDLLVFAWSGESVLGWEELFSFSFLGIGAFIFLIVVPIGASFQLATRANWPLVLGVSEQVAPVGASFTH